LRNILYKALYSQPLDALTTPPLYIKILAGFVTGAIGILVANPSDVVKVRLQA